MNRYKKILDLIDIFQPQTIAEIGVWNGQNAIRMVNTALNNHSHVSYIGYDLFEDANTITDEEEFNIKPHHSVQDVEALIREHTHNSDITLVKGNTRETLKPLCVDFVFLDGGHSLETIASDYEAVKRSSVIVLDDFYLPDENGDMPDISKLGCNRLLDGIPHAVIDTRDAVATGGIVALAVVFGG